MCEFTPAADFRATQGTAFAQQTTHDHRVSFSLVPFSWTSKRKELVQTEGLCESFFSHHSIQYP
jgi:hypothetical protein